MGAICGFATLRNNLVSEDLLQKMSNTLHHRGPNYENHYFDKGVGIAFRSLKNEIFYQHDVAITEKEKVFFAGDGNIINLEILDKENIAKNADRSNNISKNFYNLYKKYDYDFISQLNGPFSLALFDKSKQIIILGRDRSGQKPLYYSFSNNVFSFASELKAIVNFPFVEKKLNLENLYWYLATGYISSPNTIYQNVFKLPEGSILILDLTNFSMKIVSFHSPNTMITIDTDSSESVLVNKLDDLLTTIVEEQVSRLEEPIGCFLSGGVDTSLILSLLKKVTNKRIKTFTAGFADPLYDERPYAKTIADFFHVKNYDCEISEDDFIESTQDIVTYFDEPFADIGISTILKAAELTKKYVGDVFSGDGADFLFGNYDMKYLYLYYKILPYFLRKPAVSSLNFIFGTSLMKKKFPNMPIKDFLGENNFFDAFFIKWKKEEIKKLLGFQIDTKEGKFYKVFVSAEKDSISNKILKAQYFSYGIDGVLVKSERVNLAHSLNVINPFLDNRVIDFASALPPNVKFKNGYGKYLNKQLLYKYIPEWYFKRPKRGSGVPFGQLTNKGMNLFINTYLNSDKIKKQGIIQDVNIIEKAIAAYRSGDYFNGHKLWTLIVFEIWMEKMGL